MALSLAHVAQNGHAERVQVGASQPGEHAEPELSHCSLQPKQFKHPLLTPTHMRTALHCSLTSGTGASIVCASAGHEHATN